MFFCKILCTDMEHIKFIEFPLIYFINLNFYKVEY
jgi:hypothetical protein